MKSAQDAAASSLKTRNRTQSAPVVRGFMNRVTAAAGFACLFLLAACHRNIQTTDAVQQGIMKYLSSRQGLSAMDVSVVSVSFRENEADATVHFQAKGSNNPASGIDMKYVLERHGNEWVVRGRAGMGQGSNPHGGGMGTNPHGATGMPALPPGHPAIPPRQ